MEIDECDITLLDLKYCERCGGLWLRPQGCEEVICATCSAQMNSLHEYWQKQNVRLALKTTIQVDGQCREMVVICGEGGNA